MTEHSVINILGTSKITFSAFTPSMIEGTNKLILIASRNHAFEGIDKCILDNSNDLGYQITFAESTYHSLSSFLDYMRDKNITAGVIPCDNSFFSDMFKNGNGGIWFSACREGLYETYLPLMEPYITQPTDIFVFDNDEAIVEIAKEKCHNPNIHFHKCIVHSVCSSINYDYTERVVHLVNGKECILVFPPDVQYISSEFKSNPLFGRAEFIFTSSEDEFRFYSMWKVIGINALHTLASVRAYIIGIREGLSLSEIAKTSFSDLIPEYEMLDYVLKIHSILYDKHLASYIKCIQASKDIFVAITTNFIKGIYNRDENVGRGLNPNHTSFDAKIDKHFPLLRSSDDSETINLLDGFLNNL